MRTPRLASASSRLSRRGALALALASLASVASGPALAQVDYPSKPIKIVVGYPAGGSVDQVGRLVGDALAARLKGSVVIDNQGGAAGAIAAQRVVSSPADGYTLLMGSSNELVATRLVNPAQRYDARKDLQAIGLVATAPVLLVASTQLGVRSLAEFIDLAKRNPGKFSYGSSGVGSTLHFAGEAFKQRAGVFMTHIPYRGVAPLTADLAGGTLDAAVISPTAALPFLQSGRLVALGGSGAQRIQALPQVPALAEHPSLKGFELVGWFALMAPKGLPADVSQKLQTALQDVIKDPAVRKKLEDAGMVMAAGHDDLGRFMQEENAKYEKLVRFANMRD